MLRRVYLPLLKGSARHGTVDDVCGCDERDAHHADDAPFTDWDTLAVRVYAFTIEGQYANAALPALLIVLTGLAPVILFSRTEQNR